MHEITWHKIILYSKKNNVNTCETKYIRNEDMIDYIFNENENPYSFIYLCNVTKASADLIRRYTKITSKHFFGKKLIKGFTFKIKRRFKNGAWIYSDNDDLNLHNIDYKI